MIPTPRSRMHRRATIVLAVTLMVGTACGSTVPINSPSAGAGGSSSQGGNAGLTVGGATGKAARGGKTGTIGGGATGGGTVSGSGGSISGGTGARS